MIYAFGQYELDTRVYELRCEGTIRPVEPQVFDVLAFLVENRDRVVSKDELLEKLWPDRFVSETTLTSRLKEARKAVGDTGRTQSVIRTQRGRGYRFVAPVEERGSSAPPSLVAEVSGDFMVPASSEPASALTTFIDRLEPPQPARESGFVGRRNELERLTEILRRALYGERQTLFITGDAGAGKTTLVNAFLDGIRTHSPVLVARGQCVENRGGGEPYMPLLDALSRLCRGSEGEKLASILEREAPSWIVQMPSLLSEREISEMRAQTGASGERMLRELGMLIDRLTSDTPLLLVLEDLHWSDYATLDAIELLARQYEPARLLVLGTWRPSDVKAARHPVYALTQELRVRDQCEVISLAPFDLAEVRAYVSSRLGNSDLEARLAAILHDRTAGNALFIRNLLDSWIEREMIVKDGQMWTLRVDLSEIERDVPDSLQHLIENQFTSLDPNHQRLLGAASVVGRHFPLALIAAALPTAEDDLERECERLARESGIIRPAGTEHWGDGSLTSRFSFVHDLYVDVIYDRLPGVRRAKLHLHVGQALEQAWHGREKEHATEIALHFQRAVDRSRGPRYLQLAAEHALERSAYREVVEHLRGALELVEQAAESRERDSAELQIRCRLAPVLVATRGWIDSGAEGNYLRAKELAENLGESVLLSQILNGLANLYEFRGEFELAESIANERISLDRANAPAQLLESHELLTCSLLHQGRYRESVDHGERALAAFADQNVSETNPDLLVVLVQAHGWMSGSLHFAGRADDALEHNAEALRLASESGNELARASANIQAAFVRFYRNEPEACRKLAEAGGVIARELRFPFHFACSRVLLGWVDAMTNPGKAEPLGEIQAGIRICEAIGARMDLPLFEGIRADVLERNGELEAALKAIDRGKEISDRGRTFFYLPELERRRGLILLRLDESRREEAIDTLEHALKMAEDQECPLFALRTARDLAKLLGGSWTERLRAVYESFEQGLDTRDLREAAATLA